MSIRFPDKEEKALLKNLISATGISETLIQSELIKLSQRAGIQPQDLTIEDLRQILADYVQDVLVSAKEHFKKEESKVSPEDSFTPLFPRDCK